MASMKTVDFPVASSRPSLSPWPRPARPVAWLCASVALVALGLGGCDRRSESNPGSTPAAVGSGGSSSGRGDAGTPSSGVEVRTPAAPDTRGGGSSGSAGVPAIPDTSGAPSSGSTGSGSSDIAPGQAGGTGATTASSGATGGAARPGGAAPSGNAQMTTNGGLPASALGNSATSSGNTNSTPQSTTGGQ